MGQFDIIDMKDAEKENNKGKKETICKVRVKMQYPVRDDLLIASGCSENSGRRLHIIADNCRYYFDCFHTNFNRSFYPYH